MKVVLRSGAVAMVTVTAERGSDFRVGRKMYRLLGTNCCGVGLGISQSSVDDRRKVVC